ncbi:hypothetical protein LEP1GSC173_0391 [Leptospira interrogans str. HAI1594]|uniref:Uncharacterized protein n=1 Tax=Leptospira interrogans str. UI 12758 TaxID=1049938 RepID=A0A0E2D8Q3_LEPIR|nr:hypothetical protein LEP1GSC080_3371 [Leptospira interrogans str. FPW2026]EKP23539.1 hypothetical protein LEP1GSC117_2201 [Leptospira interrogans serovar Icterohaemorrhagiae str. Verdun LP]EKP78049.1 hypothetical protein LEP1GSC173_0391 [Leptospira interrogans str. HAI1594]EKR55856.1 hypothetical protein LEP1GSC105_2403 [Leptospira interrogans str. UI 12758]EMF73214.1 hypothetical protein LEP1GSC148_2166 [Leptospira interrogans serovar Canicola str. LT1962]EMJ55008.1 hypothetical protein LE
MEFFNNSINRFCIGYIESVLDRITVFLKFRIDFYSIYFL